MLEHDGRKQRLTEEIERDKLWMGGKWKKGQRKRQKALYFSSISKANMIIYSLGVGEMRCFQKCKALQHFTNKNSFLKLSLQPAAACSLAQTHTLCFSSAKHPAASPFCAHVTPDKMTNLDVNPLVLSSSSCKKKY